MLGPGLIDGAGRSRQLVGRQRNKISNGIDWAVKGGRPITSSGQTFF
jgi:hypothetical protein